MHDVVCLQTLGIHEKHHDQNKNDQSAEYYGHLPFDRMFHYSTSNLYPIPQMVLIYSPLSPSLLLSFLTWVSIVLASPK